MPVCPVCERDESTRFLEIPPLLQCSCCGLVSSRQGSVVSDYPRELDYYEGAGKEGLLDRLEHLYIRMRWRREVHFLKRFILADSSVLDIGSGNGMFLRECERECIHAEGIEKRIEPESGERNILKIDIEKEALPQKRYDAITLYHSLEHMKNPGLVLERVRGMLREGGILILQVPNIDSWQFRIFRDKWFHLFMPYHRYHFSTGTLCRLLQSKGFSVIHIRFLSNRWNPEGWSASIMRWNPVYFIRKKREGHNLVLEKLLYLLITMLFIPVSFLESIFKKGGVITLVARKER